ncbi:hypothetical protein FO519_008678 [Halicephalobus sp. NKZ332]|nr:hypothetical protein FO519_008678 [Halicephalobus sp. NKZ332]
MPVPSSYSNRLKCLAFVTPGKLYLTADGFCNDEYNGHLVSVENGFVNMFITQNADTSFVNETSQRFWIGANNITGSGWKNTDGSDATYKHWASDEPKNLTGSNGCVSVDLKGLWYNDDCFTNYPYVCGILDLGVPSTTTSTGVTTQESVTTSPREETSVFNRYSKRWRCLAFVSPEKPYLIADAFCNGEYNQHLVSIKNAYDNIFIASVAYSSFVDKPFKRYWIGRNNISETGWSNIDGSNTNYSNWASGEPASSTEINGCISVDLGGNHIWNEHHYYRNYNRSNKYYNTYDNHKYYASYNNHNAFYDFHNYNTFHNIHKYHDSYDNYNHNASHDFHKHHDNYKHYNIYTFHIHKYYTSHDNHNYNTSHDIYKHHDNYKYYVSYNLHKYHNVYTLHIHKHYLYKSHDVYMHNRCTYIDIYNALQEILELGIFDYRDGIPINTVVFTGAKINSTDDTTSIQEVTNELIANGSTVTVVLIDPNADPTNYTQIDGLNVITWTKPDTLIENILKNMTCGGDCPVYHPCKTWISFAQDYSNTLSPSDFQTQINFISDAIGKAGDAVFGQQTSKLNLWIGVNNTNGAGWKNVDDGSDTTYFDWGNGEPNNSTGNYDRCVSMNLTGLWHSEDCTKQYYFFCGVPEASSYTTPQYSTPSGATSLPSLCHSYIPFAVDISSDVYDGLYNPLRDFLLIYFIKQLFPFNLQPSPMLAFTNETSFSMVPDSTDELLAYTSAILNDRGSEPSNLSLAFNTLTELGIFDYKDGIPINSVLFIGNGNISDSDIPKVQNYVNFLTNNGSTVTVVLVNREIDQTDLKKIKGISILLWDHNPFALISSIGKNLKCGGGDTVYHPCKTWVSFVPDYSNSLSSKEFSTQMSFVSTAIGQINHPERIQVAESVGSMLSSWDEPMSIASIQDALSDYPQDQSMIFSLKESLEQLFQDGDGVQRSIGTLVFVSDTSTPGNYEGAEDVAQLLKNSGYKLTFILMGPNVDESKLTKYTTNFIYWRNLSNPQPENWDQVKLGAYGCD